MSMERFPPLAKAPMQYLCKGNLLFKLENIIHLIISSFVRILRNSKQKEITYVLIISNLNLFLIQFILNQLIRDISLYTVCCDIKRF